MTLREAEIAKKLRGDEIRQHARKLRDEIDVWERQQNEVGWMWLDSKVWRRKSHQTPPAVVKPELSYSESLASILDGDQ